MPSTPTDVLAPALVLLFSTTVDVVGSVFVGVTVTIGCPGSGGCGGGGGSGIWFGNCGGNSGV